MFLGMDQREGYPATIKIVEEGSSLVVHMALKATWGTFTPPDFCGFYDEFGENVKRSLASTQTKQPALVFQKSSEREKECSPPLPSLPASLSSSPPPAMAAKVSPPSLPRGKIIWVYVNLREGPGIQYKIIGKAYMKNIFGILSENPGWLRVRLEDGAEGWISKKAVTLDSSMTSSPQTLPASPSDSSGSKLSAKPLSPM